MKLTNREIEAARLYFKEKCENSFFSFVKAHWKIIEPGREFQSNWHIEAICEHLEAVNRGEIRNLLINMPPRHMKSILVSVMFTPWVWLKDPWKCFLYSSYAEKFSIRDSIKSRLIIQHPDYKWLFDPDWKLTGDQNAKTQFINTARGHRTATSVGGSATGDGGDVIIVDDPHSKNDSKSDVKRQGQNDWWKETMSTRGNDPRTVCKVVVMQRLHDQDLSGEILESGDYDHLMLPAEFDPSRTKVTSIGFKDPRKKTGDLLWPERFGKKEISQLKHDLGPDEAEGQLNQDPTPIGGGTFNPEWWNTYEKLPTETPLRVWQFWDCAEKPGVSNDFSVCATWGEYSNGYYLLDLWRGKVNQPTLHNIAIEIAQKHSPDNIVIEDKSGGVGLIQHLALKTKLPVQSYLPRLSKETRALNATPTVAARRCWIPKQMTWVCGHEKTDIDYFKKEHSRFPLVKNDDIVDTTSMMVEHFTKQTRQLGIRRL